VSGTITNNMTNVTKITSSKRFLFRDLLELRDYKDLLYHMFRREVIATYKQSIFGVLWFIAQPLSLTLVYYFIFTEIADLKITKMPPALFYLTGVVAWSTFQEIYSNTSACIVNNAHLFSKVYFPRLIAPLSVVSTVLLKTLIQFLGILIFSAYANYSMGIDVFINPIYLFLSVLMIVLLSFGLGLLTASLSVVYKDLKFILSYAVGLLMYVSPVMYSIEALDKKYAILIKYNPLTSFIEILRSGIVNSYSFDQGDFIRSSVVTCIVFVLGILVFGKVEKDCVDRV